MLSRRRTGWWTTWWTGRWVVAAGVGLSAVGLLGSAVVGGPSGATAARHRPRTTYYVAIGASESVGVQPVPGHRRGRRTDHGYANDLAATLRHRWPGLRLVQFGCPGTTVAAAVDGGGACRYPSGSQLATAVGFIRAHAATTVVATVDLGFNDLRPCLAHERVGRSCVATTLREVARHLRLLLRRLAAAGGPGLHVVGLEHNDPFLGFYLGGPKGRRFAQESVVAFDRLNAVLRSAYRAAGDPVADVPRAFDVGNLHPVLLRGHGRVPAEVALACRLGWTCSPLPYAHHNVHPNTRGYDAIADAAAHALGAAGAERGGRA